MLFRVFGRMEPVLAYVDANMDDVIAALRDGKTITYGSLESPYFG
jgi:hypothetical protein